MTEPVPAELSWEDDECSSTGDPMNTLRLHYLAIAATEDEQEGDDDDSKTDTFERSTANLDLTDYAHELAFLPDLTDVEPTKRYYGAPNVKSSSHTPAQSARLVVKLQKHEGLMISSGDALPPPAYGALCDIDVQGHAPIKQKARRIFLRHLSKLYELLKGLLRAGLILFSSSPWASPVGIVLKKNGMDIRLCIDYKLVNAITTPMEYAMPLVDDLLTDLESYLWFCSLDAASRFWAVLMTRRARQISAFVCALGQFEWLRMPFGLKNAPMIYQRLIDNALWRYVQPKGGWKSFAERTADAEAESGARQFELGGVGDPTPGQLKFEADHPSQTGCDPVQDLVNGPDGDMFANGEPDQSNLIPVFKRRSFVDDICFGGETFDACLETLDRLLARFTECRISISFIKSIFVQAKVDFLSHAITPSGVRVDAKKIAAIAELSFPKSKKEMQAFLGALNYYGRFIQNLAVYGAVLYHLKDTDFGPGGDLASVKASFAELKRRVAEAPILRHFDSAKEVHIVLYANDWALSSTMMQPHDDKLHPVRFYGRLLKENEFGYHPAEKEVVAMLQLIKVCYTLFGREDATRLHPFLNAGMESEFNSKSLYGRAVSFAVLLSPYDLKVKQVRERDVDFAQLLQASITPFIGLDDSLKHLAPPSKNSTTVKMGPELLYARRPADFAKCVLSFDGSAKTAKYGGYGSCSWILWRLPNWDIEIAASAYLSSTTVNITEYTGMDNRVLAAIGRGITDLIIVGDSRLAIQQSMGVIAFKKETLQVELARHKDLTKRLNSVRYRHIARHYNAAADSLATEALEAKAGRVILGTDPKAELRTINRVAEELYATDNQAETPIVTAVTRSQVRRARFEDELDEDTAIAKEGSQDHETISLKPGTSVFESGGAELEQDNRASTRLTNRTTPNAETGSQIEAVQTAPNANDTNPVIVQTERRRRIAKAQDEELRWADLKAYLRGEFEDLTHHRAQNVGKVAEVFVLSEDGLSYREMRRADKRRAEPLIESKPTTT